MRSEMNKIRENLQCLIAELTQEVPELAINDEMIESYLKSTLLPQIQGAIKQFFSEKLGEKIEHLLAAEPSAATRPVNREPEIQTTPTASEQRKTVYVETFSDFAEPAPLFSQPPPMIPNRVQKDIGIPEKNQELIAILLRQRDSNLTNLITDLKTQELNQTLVNRLIDTYVTYYNHPADRIARDLEYALTNLKNFRVVITHANINSRKDMATRFSSVSKNMLSKLTSIEKEKIKDKIFDSVSHEDLILFELSPQISSDGEIKNLGRIIVS